MNAKEKRLGTKAQIRAIKNRERRTATAIFLVFILLIVVFSSYFTYNFLNQPQNQTTNPTTNPASSQLKAAIVDQLSLTCPNQTFIENATNTLKQAGYTVDYYPGEKVTVEFYRNLPTHSYALIILRVHSALGCVTTKGLSGNIDLFASESYSTTRYVYEQLTNQVGKAMFLDGGPTYFSILPKFVRQSMNGKFQDTTIIMMGCYGTNIPINGRSLHREKRESLHKLEQFNISKPHRHGNDTPTPTPNNRETNDKPSHRKNNEGSWTRPKLQKPTYLLPTGSRRTNNRKH